MESPARSFEQPSQSVRTKASHLYTIICVSGFAQVFSIGIMQLLTPLHASSLQIPYSVIGVIVSSYWLSRCFTELPVGMISDKIGRRSPLLAGMALTALGLFGFGSSDSAVILTISRATFGIGTAIFYSIGTSLITEVYTRGRRGFRVGVLESIERLGLMLGSAAGGFLGVLFGFQYTFYLCTICVLAAAALLHREQFLKSFDKARVHTRVSPSLTSFKQLFRVRPLVLIVYGTFLIYFVNHSIVFFTLPLHAQDKLGMNVASVGGLMAARAVGLALGALLMAHIMSRIKRRVIWLLFYVSYPLIVLAIGYANHPLFLGLLMFLNGIALSIAIVLFPIIISDFTTSSVRGTAMGTYRTSLDVGGSIGPIVMAGIAETFDTQAVFLAASALMLLGLLPLVMMPLTSRETARQD